MRGAVSVDWFSAPRVEGAAWPTAGAAEPLWDIHSHVITETTHRTVVYQAGDVGTTSR